MLRASERCGLCDAIGLIDELEKPLAGKQRSQPTAPGSRGRRTSASQRFGQPAGRDRTERPVRRKVARLPCATPHRVCAFSKIASNTGARSPGEELMTCNTSAVAVCCSSASRVSVISRAFSIAMTACAAKVLQQRDLLVGKRLGLSPRNRNRAEQDRRPAASAPRGGRASPTERCLASAYSGSLAMSATNATARVRMARPVTLPRLGAWG